jgi:hypothetical protein
MDEGTKAAAVEQAPPAIETTQPETETVEPELELSEEESETEGEDGEIENEGEEAEQEPEPEPELVEVEFNGKTYKVAPELKDGFLMQADYTRKTQEVAETKRSLEARAAEVERNFAVSEEVLGARAALMNIDAQLEQYQNVNWQQLENEDPLGAMSHWRQFNQLKEQRGQVTNYLNEAQAKRANEMEQDTANRLRQTREFAEKEIKGWSPELDNKITHFAVNDLGIGIEELKSAYTPTVYRTLYLAYLGQQTLAKQAATPKPTTPVKPLTTVSSKASPSARKPIGEMSMEEYAAHRKAQMAKGR